MQDGLNQHMHIDPLDLRGPKNNKEPQNKNLCQSARWFVPFPVPLNPRRLDRKKEGPHSFRAKPSPSHICVF